MIRTNESTPVSDIPPRPELSLRSALLEEAGFRHGFSLRPQDLQLGDDSSEALVQFASSIAIDPDRVRQAKQVHGTKVLDLRGRENEERGPLEEADAIVSRSRVAVGVRTADCVPILIADRQNGAVLAIHAGWRGLVAGVIEAGVATLAIPPSSLVAAIGPHIGPCCFEIGDEVALAMTKYAGETAVRTGAARPHGDLRRAARTALQRLGLQRSSVDDVEGCTFCDATRFFSYRRDANNSGRHLALIAPRA